MQRPSINSRSSHNADADAVAIDIPGRSGFPGSSRREASGNRSSEKWIHLIPVVVLLCLFILWLFSHPVNVEIEDGRIIVIENTERPEHLNDTHVDHTLLASITQPFSSTVEFQPFSSAVESQPVSNNTAAEPATTTD